MRARWYHVAFVMTMLAMAGCDPNGPGNEDTAQPDGDDGNDEPDGPDESTQPEGPDDVEVDPLLLSGRFGVAFAAEVIAEGEADGLAVRAVLNHAPTLSSLDIDVTNEGEGTKGAVQVRVRVDYSDVTRSDPDPDAEESSRLPVEQPDEVVAAATTSVGSCRVEPDGVARALVTCDLGALAAQSEARVSTEFVSDDRAGSIDLVIDVAARN